jgi:hypothetical protein
MRVPKTKWLIAGSACGAIIVAAVAYSILKPKTLLSHYLSATPLKPIISPRIYPASIAWDNNFLALNGVKVHIDAPSVCTIGKLIQFSDEKEPHYFHPGRFLDYTLLEIRVDSMRRYLFLRTTDMIWNPKPSKNVFLFQYDLTERRFISSSEIAPNLLPSPRQP